VAIQEQPQPTPGALAPALDESGIFSAASPFT
jgi:hypothetical protein